MKTIKPLRLMVMPRPYRWRNGKYLAVTVAALIKHEDDRPKILPEYTLMHDVLPELDCEEMFDYIMPKPNPEYLVSGYAYTAHQQDKKKCMVRAKVEDKLKEGIVFGDRYWNADEITEPQPFERMSLSWKNSFGGSDFAENPLGTGLDPVELNGLSAIKLPNLESPLERVHSKGQRVSPLNFGQVRIDWPHRLKKMGTFDQDWVENVGVGFFDDMQPTVFNAASEDQIWKEKEALSMDESFEFWNMHPDLQCWSGQLPPLHARCFIKRRGNEEDLDEIFLKPTTVWFLPHRMSYMLLFHGNIAIQEDDAFDVASIMAAMEVIGQPRTLEHYLEVFKIRSDVKQAALHVFKDEALMPGDMLAPWIENLELGSQHAMLSKAARMGDDSHRFPKGSFVGPIKPFTLTDLPRLLEQADKTQAETMAEHERRREKALADASDSAASPPSKMAKARAEIYRELDFSGDSKEMKRLPISGPPDHALQEAIKSAEQREAMRAVIRDGSKGQGMNTLGEAAAFTRQSLSKMYLYSVHYQEGVARVADHRAVALRKRVQQKYDLGKNLSKLNLTGADLSGMDLSGADFSETWLESVDFSDANLSGAKFDESVLARGTFHRTNLDNARLNKTNISEAVFDTVSFNATTLQSLICEPKTTFKNCQFTDSLIEDFNFRGGEFVGNKFNNSKFINVTLQNCNFDRCEIDGGTLEKLNFEDSVVADWVAIGVSISGGANMNSSFTRVEITRSTFEKTTFFEDVVFHDSVLKDNHFRQTMFREVPFYNVDFSGSTFEQSDFSQADLRKCRLRKISAPQSMFMRTNFDMADLSGSNLMYGSFQKSSFIGANLSDCNFFRADMSESILDDSTRTDNAYVHRTRLAPFHDGVNRMGRQ